MTPSVALTNHGNRGIRHLHGLGYFFIGASLISKIGYSDCLPRIKFVKRGRVPKAFAFGINASGSSLSGGILHVVRACSLEKMVRINASGIIAFVANIVSFNWNSFMKDKAGDMGTQISASGTTPANNAISALNLGRVPNPTRFGFGNFFNKSARQRGRAADGLQKLWSDVFGVKTPFNKFNMSHVTNF